MRKTALLQTCLSILLLSGALPAKDRPALVVVLVIDGLRPDSITPEASPNLDRLRKAGVWYTRSHSLFPTVTRVNAATISTGTVPSQHGIVSNSLYLPSVSPTPLGNGDYRTLLSLAKLNGGRVVGPKSLQEYLQAAGIAYVAVSSGSTGNAVLLNPTAPYGNGTLINPGFENGARVAFPDALSTDLLARYGPVKADEGSASLLWIERVLREYVLDKLHPQVIVDWMGATDSAQHKFGVGSPEGLAALRLVDEQIEKLVDRLRELKLEDKTDIIVTCDHGFDYEPAADVMAPLREANLAPADVVVDHEGGSSFLYVKDHDPEKISRLVAKFQAGSNTNAIFVAATRPKDGTFICSKNAVKGFAPGTFALELASQCLPSHGPDLIVTYRWEQKAGPFGVAGTQYIPGRRGAEGAAAHNGHGGLNPYVTHSTLLAAGPDFARGVTIDVPAGNQDITPTLLMMQGLAVPAAVDGRVLSEALRTPPNAAKLKSKVSRIEAKTGAYCAELELSYAGDHRYLNQARRCGTQP